MNLLASGPEAAGKAQDHLVGNAGAAVLGMIALGARAGYEIKRAGERSLRFFWALGPPQIYAELKRLEASGLIAGADDARGQRPRRTFELTAAGRRALHAWLTRADADPLELRDPEMLRVFFADALAPEELRAQVARMRERAEQTIARFEREIVPAAERTAEHGHAYPREVARFGLELQRLMLDWCERLEAAAGDGP